MKERVCERENACDLNGWLWVRGGVSVCDTDEKKEKKKVKAKFGRTNISKY